MGPLGNQIVFEVIVFMVLILCVFRLKSFILVDSHI